MGASLARIFLIFLNEFRNEETTQGHYHKKKNMNREVKSPIDHLVASEA